MHEARNVETPTDLKGVRPSVKVDPLISERAAFKILGLTYETAKRLIRRRRLPKPRYHEPGDKNGWYRESEIVAYIDSMSRDGEGQ